MNSQVASCWGWTLVWHGFEANLSAEPNLITQTVITVRPIAGEGWLALSVKKGPLPDSPSGRKRGAGHELCPVECRLTTHSGGGLVTRAEPWQLTLCTHSN